MNSRAAGSALALILFGAGSARAESLGDALAQAYRTNPVLLGQRAGQQVLDETYVQARVGFHPTASVVATAAYEREDLGAGLGGQTVAAGSGYISAPSGGHVEANSGQSLLSLTQPLYTGGRTTWAVRSAKARVRAGREGLRTVEANVLLSVIQAYVDVLRDQEILSVRRSDLATLDRQVAESTAKFDLGQVTATDVAQAKAQREAAKVALAAADAQLEISRAEYTAAVGTPPDALTAPAALPGLPASVDQAFDLAEASNPMLNQSRLTEQASRDQIAEARAAYRPTVALQGSLGYIGPVAPLDTRDYDRDITAQVVITQPLLTGGLMGSQVRAAVAQNTSDRIAIETARRQVVQAVSSDWSKLLSGRAGVVAGQAGVEAAAMALKGSQAEYGFALRTTLDVLIADENLREAQITLAESRHDAYLAEASVLDVSGRLEARYLLPGEPLYDSARSFDNVRSAGDTPLDPLVAGADQLGRTDDPEPRIFGGALI